jgi:hypothetical protein
MRGNANLLARAFCDAAPERIVHSAAMPKVFRLQNAAAYRTPAYPLHNPHHLLYDGIPVVRLRPTEEHERNSPIRVDD